MNCIKILGLAFFLQTSAMSHADPALVGQAEAFASGKKYKLTPSASDRSSGFYDCSTFVQAVLAKAGYQVGGATGRRLNIVLQPDETKKLRELVENRVTAIKGPVAALVESNQGTEISSLTEVRPGDIVQLWRVAGESARGHTGIVKSVSAEQKRIVLIGAHNPTDGVGPKEFDLGSAGWSIWFAVRPRK